MTESVICSERASRLRDHVRTREGLQIRQNDFAIRHGRPLRLDAADPRAMIRVLQLITRYELEFIKRYSPNGETRER